MHLDQAFAVNKQEQRPNSRSHDPKAHALVLDTLSSSAQVKAIEVKVTPGKIHSVFADHGANRIMCRAGHRWAAEPSSDRAHAEVKVRAATTKLAGPPPTSVLEDDLSKPI